MTRHREEGGISIRHPCTKDCPNRREGCAVTCEAWQAYTQERDKVYARKADGGRLGRVPWERRRTI